MQLCRGTDRNKTTTLNPIRTNPDPHSSARPIHAAPPTARGHTYAYTPPTHTRPIPTPPHSPAPSSQPNHPQLHRSTCTFTPTCTNQTSRLTTERAHSLSPPHHHSSQPTPPEAIHPLTTYYLLLTTYYSRLTTYHSLLMTYYSLFTACYLHAPLQPPPLQPPPLQP